MKSCFACLAILSFYAVALGQQAPVGKKLIEYGWDVPNPQFVREHIREMEKRPFDGLILRMAVGGRVFVKEKWTPAQVDPDFEHLANIEWRQFTDNFLMMYAASDVDWFSDADWEAVVHNVRLTARGAKIGKCVGVCFDAEPYGTNPWHYPAQPHAAEKSFAEYYAKYRERGAQFMDAIQSEMPEAVVHTFFLFPVLGHLWEIDDLASREQKLSQEHYGLYAAFINGMLDAMQPGITLTDGNEPAYYYKDPLSFYRVYHGIRQRAVSMVAPENVRTYKTQVQVAQALYVDYVFKMWPNPTPAEYLTPEERARWFAHNVYYALTTSDRYVWLYSEKMNWWLNQDLPPGLEEATASARAKVAAHQGLGFDIEPMMKAAQERQREQLRAKLIQRKADIAKLAGAAPMIDGDLNDAAWQGRAPLEPFVPYVNVTKEGVQPTEARVTYDAAALYVGVRSVEPKQGEMQIVGEKRDDSVWMGDSVDVFIQPAGQAPVYYHFIINPKNVLWDARWSDGDDLGYNATARTAAKLGNGEWTAEIAVPWADLKMEPPAAGTTCRANICRQRLPDREQTAWSQTVSGFVEPDNFGTWTFR